jgi:hypothetical protein
MKHLKSFENINNSPKVGDYVITKNNIYSTSAFGPDEIVALNDHIHKIIEVVYLADGEVITYKLDAFYDNIRSDFFTNRYTYRYESELLYWSPNKEDCKIFLQANKFNL